MPQTPAEWFQAIINRLINIVVWPVFVGVVVVMFIWAGFLFLTAHGDPTKLQAAQKAVIWAVVGIIVGLIAFSAITIISTIIPAPPSP